jgi:hypothetical protein
MITLTNNTRVISKQKTSRANKETKEICPKSTKSSPIKMSHDERREFVTHPAGSVQELDVKWEKKRK